MASQNFPLRDAIRGVMGFWQPRTRPSDAPVNPNERSSMKLSGKVALVTGSSQGIGAAIAIRLAGEGADIVVNYHSHPDEANDVKAKIESLGRRAVAVGADLGAVASVNQLIADGIAAFGQIDILINNAGVEKNASFWDITEHDYDFVLNTNLKGPFFATQAFVKHLQARKAPGIRSSAPSTKTSPSLISPPIAPARAALK